MPEKPKIAIIGLGRWGQNLVREFGKLADLTLVPHHGTPSYEETLARPEIQAVVIATPIATHFAIAKQALEAGKQVFLEKPICSSSSEAEILVNLAAERKLILAVGHVYLYHQVFDKITELVGDEQVEYLETVWYKYGSFIEEISFNLLCHELASILKLMGTPETLTITREEGGVSTGDILESEIKFADGRRAISLINRLAPFKNKSLLLKTKTKTLWWTDDELFLLTADGYQSIFKATVTPLELECQAFIKSLESHTAPRADGTLGLEVVKLLEQLTPAKFD
jgi:UDP-2-acetamido-3-amino-2,3-dideoxy-glucuronate N-acetyltransferase